MKFLDLTFPTPAENLACDEALLENVENGFTDEILRVWEPAGHFIVLGYSGRVKREVRMESCKKREIPVLRRPTGGGTVLQGPGCLNFALILKMNSSKDLSNITRTNAYVLERHARAFEKLLGKKVEIQGQSDLTLGPLKFSGNAQRRRKGTLLFHGSFLLEMDIPLIEELLLLPEKRPAYRNDRPHRDFLINLNLSPLPIKKSLQEAWKADEPLSLLPLDNIRELAGRKYGDNNWNFKF